MLAVVSDSLHCPVFPAPEPCVLYYVSVSPRIGLDVRLTAGESRTKTATWTGSESSRSSWSASAICVGSFKSNANANKCFFSSRSCAFSRPPLYPCAYGPLSLLCAAVVLLSPQCVRSWPSNPALLTHCHRGADGAHADTATSSQGEDNRGNRDQGASQAPGHPGFKTAGSQDASSLPGCLERGATRCGSFNDSKFGWHQRVTQRFRLVGRPLLHGQLWRGDPVRKRNQSDQPTHSSHEAHAPQPSTALLACCSLAKDTLDATTWRRACLLHCCGWRWCRCCFRRAAAYCLVLRLHRASIAKQVLALQGDRGLVCLSVCAMRRRGVGQHETAVCLV